MNGKRFSLGLVAIIAFMVLLTTGLVWSLPEERYMDGEYPYWKQQKDYTLKDGTQLEALLLGDSRIKIGVRPELLGDDVYNLALGGGTPMEMYYTLVDYLKHHPVPRIIIVSFGPMHYARAEVYMGRNAYFHYFSNGRLRETNQKILELDGIDYRSECHSYMYRLPQIYMKRVISSLSSPRTSENRKIYKKSSEARGRMFGATRDDLKNVEPPESNEEHFHPLASQTYYMQKLIETCLEHHIPLHIEQAPMGRYGLAKLKASGYLAEYEAYMQNFADAYPIDVNPIIPGYEDDEFGDVSHLNEKGQIRFTEELRKKYFE